MSKSESSGANAAGQAIELPEGHVHIWQCCLDSTAIRFSDLEDCLSREEQIRAERLAVAKVARRFIAGRGMVRHILSRYLGIKPGAIALECGKNGKPELSGGSCPDIRFNASHSLDLLVAAVVCGSPVGVDVEWVQEDVDWDKVARQFFSPAEASVLEALPPEQRIDAFYRVWTRKEACLKRIGQGVCFPIDQVVVSIMPGRGARIIQCPPEAGLEDTCLFDLDVPAGFVGSLAVSLPDPNLCYWRL